MCKIENNKKVSFGILLVYLFPVISISLILIRNFHVGFEHISCLQIIYEAISIMSSSNSSIVSTIMILKNDNNLEEKIYKRFFMLIISIVIYLIVELLYKDVITNSTNIVIMIILLLITIVVSVFVFLDYNSANKKYSQIINNTDFEKFNIAKNKDNDDINGTNFNIEGKQDEYN